MPAGVGVAMTRRARAVSAPRRRLALALTLTTAIAVMAGSANAVVQDAASASPFVEIPAGPFVMGAGQSTSAGAFDNERWSPASGDGTLTLPAFYLAQREVSVADFAAFVQATAHPVDPRALAAPPDAPVAYVSWTDAVAYCRWLTERLASAADVPPALRERIASGWRAMLPTEAQWEKAARGGDRRIYPWGDTLRRDRGQFEAQAPAAVGAHPCPECAEGLEDLAGNVWEWTRSPSQPYPYDDEDDRRHLDADALWVIRGGGFADPPRLVRTTTRGAAEPGARRAFIGIRVAIVPPASGGR